MLEVETYLNIDDHCSARAFLHNTQICLSCIIVDVREIFLLVIAEISNFSSDSIELAVGSAATIYSRLRLIGTPRFQEFCPD